MSVTTILWLEKHGGQGTKEIRAQGHLTVELVVISPLTEFIIGIDQLRRWKSLTPVPLNVEVKAFMARRATWKTTVVVMALTAWGDWHKQSKITCRPFSSWASLEVRLNILKPEYAL